MKTYLPFCVSRLLEHLSYLGRRETIVGELEGCSIFSEGHKPLQNIKNFIKLFLLNQEITKSNSVSGEYQSTILGRMFTHFE